MLGKISISASYAPQIISVLFRCSEVARQNHFSNHWLSFLNHAAAIQAERKLPFWVCSQKVGRIARRSSSKLGLKYSHFTSNVWLHKPNRSCAIPPLSKKTHW
uniref:Uncharacterized protein n=1 Tax=Micrurus spixii TaxID=129469 RepID=A0A2D4N9I5_9SAUR